jgi:capsular exopolysaccharide synthesis family protein
MSRYLSGQSELSTEIQQLGIPNLLAVPAGPVPPNPPELIGSARMKLALQLLARYFEFIIVDGPPLLLVTDALVISPQVDGVLLVVQGGKTPTAIVQKARNLLRSVDARILGALVNDLDMKKAQYGYYQGGYYSGGEDNYSVGA